MYSPNLHGYTNYKRNIFSWLYRLFDFAPAIPQKSVKFYLPLSFLFFQYEEKADLIVIVLLLCVCGHKHILYLPQNEK